MQSFLVAMFATILLLGAALSRAAPLPAGKLVTLRGEVAHLAVGAAEGAWGAAQAGQLLNAGDRLRTGRDGWLSLLLADETLIQVGRNSTFELKEVEASAGWLSRVSTAGADDSRRSRYRLDRGRLWLLNKNRDADIKVDTPTVTAAIRGTELFIEVADDNSARVGLLEGRVEVSNELGAVTLLPGEEASARPGSAPVKRILLNPRNAVQWTVNLPAMLDSRDILLSTTAETGGMEGEVGLFLQALQARDLGRMDEAAALAASLGDLPLAGVVDGWLLLDRGEVEAALERWNGLSELTDSEPGGRERLIGMALAELLNDRPVAARARIGAIAAAGDEAVRMVAAWAAVAAGEAEEAVRIVRVREQITQAHKVLVLALLMLDRIDEAASAAAALRHHYPKDPVVRVASGLVAQAQFRLDVAASHYQQALELDPDEITALLALARVRFGQGDNRAAIDALQRADGLLDGEPEVDLLRGFIALADRNQGEADALFERAVNSPGRPADAWLGKALVSMRAGKEPEAMEAMTTAVLLAPERSLMRSYWAKLLYQQQRHRKALDVLDIARELDPNDPTPELYRALILRDLRQPGEAIAALRRSIERNDRRAVYRSRSLLDRDLAVRNVDLSLLYRDLALDRRAVENAIDSTRYDYANASAHLFHAGALSERDNRSWTRNTENLLARLLMPANQNSFNSFNDYTTFLEQPAVDGSIELGIGSQRTKVGNLAIFGAEPAWNLAWQAGLLSDRDEGWRKSNGSDERHLIGYLKWDQSDSMSWMGVVSATSNELRDKLVPRYEIDDPAEPNDRLDGELRRIELGLHHTIAQGSDLLLHFARIDSTTDLTDSSCLLSNEVCRDGWRAEEYQRIALDEPYSQLQGEWIGRWRDWQLIAGGARYLGRRSLDYSAWIEIDPPPEQLPLGALERSGRAASSSLFFQPIWQPDEAWLLEAAIQYDRLSLYDPLSDRQLAREHWSPRLGAYWQGEGGWRLRAGWFKTILPFYGDRLEPPDIAGIPLHRNGQAGSENREAQIVLNHEGEQLYWEARLFDLERSELVAAGETPLVSRYRGAELAADLLYGERMGIYGSLSWFDRSHPTSAPREMVEGRLTLGGRWLGESGWSVGVEQLLRRLEFDDRSRSDETIHLTDLELRRTLGNKMGELVFELRNLFDQQFNWVVDPFANQGRVPEREWYLALELNL